MGALNGVLIVATKCHCATDCFHRGTAYPKYGPQGDGSLGRVTPHHYSSSLSDLNIYIPQSEIRLGGGKVLRLIATARPGDLFRKGTT